MELNLFGFWKNTHINVSGVCHFKSHVFLFDFIAKSEERYNSKMASWYCCISREYLRNEMKNCCNESGICYQLTFPSTPQWSETSDSMVRTKKACSMLVGADLDKFFMWDAVLTATYCINLGSTKI